MKSTLLFLGVLFYSCVQPIESIPSIIPSLNAPCDDLTGRWTATDPDALVCLEVDAESDSLLSLLRNGTEVYFVWGQGNVDRTSYSHLGFSAIWPQNLGVAGYAGECHKCEGRETIMMSSVSHNKYLAPGCGQAEKAKLTTMYRFYRSGPSCRGLTLDVRGAPAWLLQKMGITALDPSQVKH